MYPTETKYYPLILYIHFYYFYYYYYFNIYRTDWKIIWHKGSWFPDDES